MISKNIYTNSHPNNTIHGLGFKDAKKAKETIKTLEDLVKKKEISIVRAKQTINVLIQRAKYHPHKTSQMNNAINIFQKWMLKHQPS